MQGIRGKEDERGQIPSFETVDLGKMEVVRKDHIDKH